MPLPNGFEFIERIEPTRELAKAMQRLTLDDLRDGTFDSPTQLADPKSPSKIGAQMRKLRTYPEQYCGVVHDGGLVAFMKTADWLIQDEIPFVASGQAFRLKTQRVLRRSYLPDRPFGVFALVVANNLSEVAEMSIFASLLGYSLDQARGRVVNIVVPRAHKRMGLAEALDYHGFCQVGRQGEAVGAPGVKQVRYQRPATSN